MPSTITCYTQRKRIVPAAFGASPKTYKIICLSYISQKKIGLQKKAYKSLKKKIKKKKTHILLCVWDMTDRTFSRHNLCNSLQWKPKTAALDVNHTVMSRLCDCFAGNNVKYLLALFAFLSPCGIMLISDAYGGKCGDEHMTRRSGSSSMMEER